MQKYQNRIGRSSSYWTIVSNVQVFDEMARLARSLGPLPLILVYLHFILVIIL